MAKAHRSRSSRTAARMSLKASRLSQRDKAFNLRLFLLRLGKSK